MGASHASSAQAGVGPARAQADRHGVGGADDLGGTLPIEDLHLCRQHLLTDQEPSDLGLAPEHAVDELLVVEQILERLGVLLHGGVGTVPHEQELEEPDHHRRRHDEPGSIPLEVENQTPLRHRRDLRIQFDDRHVQSVSKVGQCDQLRELASDVGVLGREQQPKDPVHGRRVGRSGDVPVEAFPEEPVFVVGVEVPVERGVGHGDLPLRWSVLPMMLPSSSSVERKDSPPPAGRRRRSGSLL